MFVIPSNAPMLKRGFNRGSGERHLSLLVSIRGAEATESQLGGQVASGCRVLGT